MGWLLPRLAVMLLVLVGSGLAGHGLGRWLQAPLVGTLVGAGMGIALLLLLEALTLGRLLRWLLTAADRPPPRLGGFWGDLAYRIERALRQREAALAAEQARLSEFLSAIEASPNGVLLLDAGDHIGWCNAVAADLLGLHPERDRGQAVTNLVRAPAFVAHLQGGDWDGPVVFSSRGGQVTLQALIRGYGDGQKLVVTQDITERLRAETMRRDFVANVSHEIRTPLTVLAGFVETMGSLPLSEGERRRVLALMEQQTQRMRALVADLLTLAQLEGSPLPASDHWVLLTPLAHRVLADARALSGGRHDIALEADGPALELAGAEPELVSAVSNLATNAVRYTPEGGRIRLGWRAREDGGAELWVSDNGIGIAREHLPRLTERFYRVDPSRARETGGTGLGLAIVKHVVQRHGGALEVDSQPGRGSTFRLVFAPVRVRPQAAAPLAATAGLALPR